MVAEFDVKYDNIFNYIATSRSGSGMLEEDKSGKDYKSFVATR